MVNISLSEDQIKKLKDGKEISVQNKEFSEKLLIELKSNSITVEAVDSIQSESGDSNMSVTNKSVPELKDKLVDTKTKRKKLESKVSDIEEDIEYFNEKIRLAKKEDRQDLVSKAKSKKSDKMEHLQELNETINKLKREEHDLKDNISDLK
jgi:phage shock protein A